MIPQHTMICMLACHFLLGDIRPLPSLEYGCSLDYQSQTISYRILAAAVSNGNIMHMIAELSLKGMHHIQRFDEQFYINGAVVGTIYVL